MVHELMNVLQAAILAIGGGGMVLAAVIPEPHRSKAQKFLGA